MPQKIPVKKLLRNIKQRLQLLGDSEYLDLLERLEIVSHPYIYRDRIADKFLRKRLSRSEAGEAFFRLGPYLIYFEADYPVVDHDFFLLGITQVLTETFLLPRLFSRQVRIKEGDVVFDVGANIGTTALLFSRHAGKTGSVFAVEPVTHQVLRKNMSANHVENVTAIPLAVAEKPGHTDILISDYCLNSSISQSETPQGYHSFRKRIELSTLDLLVEQLGIQRLDFIKMDIEGAEEWALRGAVKTIERYRPKWSISSYHQDFTNEAQHPKLVRLLKDYGYNIHEEDSTHIFAW